MDFSGFDRSTEQGRAVYELWRGCWLASWSVGCRWRKAAWFWSEWAMEAAEWRCKLEAGS